MTFSESISFYQDCNTKKHRNFLKYENLNTINGIRYRKVHKQKFRNFIRNSNGNLKFLGKRKRFFQLRDSETLHLDNYKKNVS